MSAHHDPLENLRYNRNTGDYAKIQTFSFEAIFSAARESVPFFFFLADDYTTHTHTKKSEVKVENVKLACVDRNVG